MLNNVTNQYVNNGRLNHEVVAKLPEKLAEEVLYTIGLEKPVKVLLDSQYEKSNNPKILVVVKTTENIYEFKYNGNEVFVNALSLALISEIEGE